jgi:hypothetical protein
MFLITLPRVSPDLSIIESIANPLKKGFYSKKNTIEKKALAWFFLCF